MSKQHKTNEEKDSIVTKALKNAPQQGVFQRRMFMATNAEWRRALDHLETVVAIANRENARAGDPTRYTKYTRKRAGFIYLGWRTNNGAVNPYAFTTATIANPADMPTC